MDCGQATEREREGSDGEAREKERDGEREGVQGEGRERNVSSVR